MGMRGKVAKRGDESFHPTMLRIPQEVWAWAEQQAKADVRPVSTWLVLQLVKLHQHDTAE